MGMTLVDRCRMGSRFITIFTGRAEIGALTYSHPGWLLPTRRISIDKTPRSRGRCIQRPHLYCASFLRSGCALDTWECHGAVRAVPSSDVRRALQLKSPSTGVHVVMRYAILAIGGIGAVLCYRAVVACHEIAVAAVKPCEEPGLELSLGVGCLIGCAVMIDAWRRS